VPLEIMKKADGVFGRVSRRALNRKKRNVKWGKGASKWLDSRAKLQEPKKDKKNFEVDKKLRLAGLENQKQKGSQADERLVEVFAETVERRKRGGREKLEANERRRGNLDLRGKGRANHHL